MVYSDEQTKVDPYVTVSSAYSKYGSIPIVSDEVDHENTALLIKKNKSNEHPSFYIRWIMISIVIVSSITLIFLSKHISFFNPGIRRVHISSFLVDDTYWSGPGHPIFFVSDYTLSSTDNENNEKDDSIFQFVIQEASKLNACVVSTIGPSDKVMEETVKKIYTRLGCDSDKKSSKYCLLVMFNISDSNLLSVKWIDHGSKIYHNIVTFNPDVQIEYLQATEKIESKVMGVMNLSDGNLRQPLVYEAKNGIINLTLEKANHSTVAATKFQTRLLGGTLPGPTIKVRPGESLTILFKNKLQKQEGSRSRVKNGFCVPDNANLHLHGAHISENLPSEDVAYEVLPGNSYEYVSKFSKTHMPGTHWIHPHVHGSSTLQVGGGAALALIVEDDQELFKIPREVENAKDILLMIQDFKLKTLLNAKTESGDKILDIKTLPKVGSTFRLVNGQYNPELNIIPGEWHRFRILYAGWRNAPLDFWIDSKECVTYLLAKDGIYIQDYPRKIFLAPIPPAGRADIMVRCDTEGIFNAMHFANETLFRIKSDLPEGHPYFIEDGPTENFNFTLPDYLSNVQDITPSPGCSCNTSLTQLVSSDPIEGKRTEYSLNGIPFDKNVPLHRIAMGSVVERRLNGVSSHPYHQHVYPFQLKTGYEEGTSATQGGYFKNGDWHDTLLSINQDSATVRYRADLSDGKIMVHCHILSHEDRGMMSHEEIIKNGRCACDVARHLEDKEENLPN